ncbi:MAG TPA: hypothetical protein VK759_05650, partial [Rhizomicrobium sp.]|nr:hypothetical protein [Rhizomicrobium sp.]
HDQTLLHRFGHDLCPCDGDRNTIFGVASITSTRGNYPFIGGWGMVGGTVRCGASDLFGRK